MFLRQKKCFLGGILFVLASTSALSAKAQPRQRTPNSPADAGVSPTTSTTGTASGSFVLNTVGTASPDAGVGGPSQPGNGTDAGVATAPTAPYLAPNPTPAPAQHPLLLDTGKQYGLGWRAWALITPPAFVSVFATVEPGWAGGVNIATGPEFIYRSGNLEVVVGAMYVGYNAPVGYVRGLREPTQETEQIIANMYGLYLTSHFLWGIRANRWFEVQLGVGIGVGYIGGNLYRSQATFRTATATTPGTWVDCVSPGRGPECGTNNNHYTGTTGMPYTEPSIFSGGSLPSLLPWVSIPQIGLHFRPHQRFDIKLETGFAFVGIYAGGSAHVFF